MNFRNLLMWGLIILLSVGLFNLFQNPERANQNSNQIAFSTFLEEVDNGRVVEVEIQGNNINFVEKCLNDISKILTINSLVILRSTIPVGSSRTKFIPLIEIP